MKKIKIRQFKYNLFEPLKSIKKQTTVIFYHGWGTDADSYNDMAEEIAKKGYKVIVPEIIYHDTRNSIENHFDKENMYTYFWKTIFESIDEFDDFFKELGVPIQNTILVGSSMGGFIANGIFASQTALGGLVNINGSGSFVLSERLFREIDNRNDLPTKEELILKKYDPIERGNCHSPVLLMHGEMDKTVPLAGQENYYKHLIENEGREDVELFIYKNINHQFTFDMLRDLTEWLNKITN